MMPFEAANSFHVACHDEPHPQLVVHATQRLKHERVRMPCLSSCLRGNSVRNSVEAFAPVDRHAHQIRSINQRRFHSQREIHPHVVSTSPGPVAKQCHGSSSKLAQLYYVTDPHRKPTAGT